MASADPASGDPPDQHSGVRLASYFENFFRTITGISTLGASITFSKIVQAPVEPFHDYGFGPQDIQYLISLSWLFFILALAFTSFFASALSLWRPQAIKAFGTTTGTERVKVLWFATAVSVSLFGLEAVAFITISLVVVAYTGAVGWVAVGLMIMFTLAGLGVIIWRSPLAWPKWVKMVEREGDSTYGTMLRRATGGEQDEDGHWHGREQLPTSQTPKQRPRQQQESIQPQQPMQRQRPARHGGSYDYGRSTSGEHMEKGEPTWRNSRKEKDFEHNRYSGASTVTSEAYEPGRFGQSGMVRYDDGIREGFVMKAYDT